MKNILQILKSYYWLSFKFFLSVSTFATHLVVDDEKTSDIQSPEMSKKAMYIREQTIIVKQKGLMPHQVNGALKIALKHKKVYMINDENICGNWKVDIAIIYRYCNEEIKKEKNYEALDYIAFSYPLSDSHQVALLIKNPYKKSPNLIIIDSLEEKRTKSENIKNLAQKIGANKIIQYESHYYKQSKAWECGLHSFCNILETVQGIDVSEKSKLMPDQAIPKVLQYLFEYQQVEDQKKIKSKNSFLDTNNLLKKIEFLLKKKGKLDDEDAKEALKQVASQLKVDKVDSLDKKNNMPKDQLHLKEKSKIDEWIKEYNKTEKSDDMMGLIALNAFKVSNDFNSAAIFYKNLFKSNLRLIQHPKKLTTKEEKLHSLGFVFTYLKKYSQALFCFNQAGQIIKEQYSESSLQYASSLQTIVAVYLDQGEYESALVYYHKILEIQVKHFGKHSLEYVITLEGIAAVYLTQKKYNQSLIYYNQALSIRGHIQGQNHQDYTATFNTVKQIYNDKPSSDKTVGNLN